MAYVFLFTKSMRVAHFVGRTGRPNTLRISQLGGKGTTGCRLAVGRTN